MYQPHNIVICNSVIYLCLHTTGDYNFLRDVPWSQKLDLRRWQLSLFRKLHGGYRLRIGGR